MGTFWSQDPLGDGWGWSDLQRQRAEYEAWERHHKEQRSKKEFTRSVLGTLRELEVRHLRLQAEDAVLQLVGVEAGEHEAVILSDQEVEEVRDVLRRAAELPTIGSEKSSLGPGRRGAYQGVKVLDPDRARPESYDTFGVLPPAASISHVMLGTIRHVERTATGTSEILQVDEGGEVERVLLSILTRRRSVRRRYRHLRGEKPRLGRY